MGLKFQRDDSLDRKFEEFAFLPDDDKKKADEEQKKRDIARFLEPEIEHKKKPSK